MSFPKDIPDDPRKVKLDGTDEIAGEGELSDLGDVVVQDIDVGLKEKSNIEDINTIDNEDLDDIPEKDNSATKGSSIEYQNINDKEIKL